jgi:protein ImuA
MQVNFPFNQAADLASIRERLIARFGKVRVEDRPDPVSQFVVSFIGSRTYEWKSCDAFSQLIQRYPTWDAMADAPVADLEATLAGVTYAEKKAPELKQALQAIRATHSQINLDFLSGYDVDQALDCLKKLHGVGPKIASATLNLSTLRMRTFVIDQHILRVLRRFGFVGIKVDTEVTHNAVMAAADGLDADDLFELHWHMKNLGQTICTFAQTLCSSCPLSDICQASLTNLKTLLRKHELEEMSVRTPLGHREADICLRGGLRHDALHEIFSDAGHEAAATGFVAGLTMRVAGRKHVLWIRQDFSIHEYGELSATGLLELGFDPARMILLSVANASDGLRAANDSLSCSALGAVVVETPGSPKVFDIVASRRLTLGAAQKSIPVFLLRFGAKPEASTAETRWIIRAAASRHQRDDWGQPGFEVSLVRNRHGKTGHWFMEWNCDECVFQEATTDHGAMVSASVN